MPVGTVLSKLRRMLKAEIGDEMDEAVADANDDRYNQLLANTEIWLVGKEAWILPGKVRKEIAIVAGQRIYDLPAGIDLQALAYPAFVKFGNLRFWMEFGISQQHYNRFSPDEALGQRCDPIMRWDVVDDDGEQKIEVWPTPASEQTLIFEGRPVPGDMEADDDGCVVDDLLLVLFTAAKILSARKGGAAEACLSQANARLQDLKAKRPSEFETFSMRGGGQPRCKNRPIVGVTDFSVSYIRFRNGNTEMLADDGLWHIFRLVTDQGQITLELDPVGSA